MISILMPIYNVKPEYLHSSVSSILDQTFEDFELLIIDDGSTDGCTKFIHDYDDCRIRLIKSHHNLIDSLNLGLKESKGKFIARMDAGDIMLTHRLQTLYDFMEFHQEVDICGSWAQMLDQEPIMQVPSSHEEIVTSPLFGNTMIHPSVIMRKSSIKDSSYSQGYSYANDYKFWIDLSLQGLRFANIPEVLFEYRQLSNKVTATNYNEMIVVTQEIQFEYLEEVIEIMASKNKLYKEALNPLIELTNNSFINGDTLQEIVFKLYYGFVLANKELKDRHRLLLKLNHTIPLVSVITVVLNAVEHIEGTINSVINQSYPNVEYIIIDGGSTDGTIDIIKKYSDSIQVFISEPDSGIYNAMNKALDFTTGEWVCFMNAGDSFYSQNTLLEVFSKTDHRNQDFIYGDVILQYKSNNVYKKGGNKNNFWEGRVCHQSILSRKSINDRFRFDEKYKYAADFDFIVKVFTSDFKIQYIPLAMSRYDMYGISAIHADEGRLEMNEIISYHQSELLDLTEKAVKTKR